MSERVVSVEARVWFGGGRRWLTKLAAYRAAARAIIAKRCECVQEESPDYFGQTCRYHEEGHYLRLRDRLVRRLMYRDQQGANNAA
jgi:hypothetical protein